VETLLLFVYGGLKKGFPQNKLLKNSSYLRKVKTAPNYLLYDCGRFACLTDAGEGKGRSIEGELFQVSILVIDELDMMDDRFERKPISVIKNDKVHAYFYQRSVSQFLDCGTSWPRD
jgi:gamma-glutamylaminecyclotransferase